MKGPVLDQTVYFQMFKNVEYILKVFLFLRNDDFEIVSGQTQFKINTLGAHANTTQIIVRPRIIQLYWCWCDLQLGEGVKLTALSSEPGQAVIIADYEKQFSSNLVSISKICDNASTKLVFSL